MTRKQLGTIFALVSVFMIWGVVSRGEAALSLFDKGDSAAFKAQIHAVIADESPAQEPADDLKANLSAKTKSNAPEPSTLALLGTGLLGMIISFIRKTYHTIKRLFDILAASFGLIILSPLFLIAAIIVRSSSRGPIFYKQTRVGKDGELFDMYKFRTMRIDAEKHGAVWAQKHDPRVIKGGHFLRKTHIDELPQLINILSGEMSLIGPRPERPMFVDQFKETIPGYEKRLLIKPGLTGLAQVWHKYDETVEDVKKKLKYDLLYIKKLCLWTDVRILLRTIRVVFTGEGAH